MSTTEITSLIPHRPPFVLIDRLLEAEEDTFVTEFTIPGDHLLVKDGYFQESGMLENMAQSVAAGVGYLGVKRGQEPKVGYIGAISRAEVLKLPRAGQTLTTRVKITHRLDPIISVQGECFHKDEKLLVGEIKLVLNE